jgi:uncharacterized protein
MSALRQLGNGWSFPVRPDPVGGGLAYRDGPEKIRQAIELILDTEPGERIMRPTFGCGLRQFLMQPNSVATRTLIAREVDTALTTFEPRIQLAEVRVLPGDDPALVFIAIAYLHLRDQRPGNLVYPFYLA